MTLTVLTPIYNDWAALEALIPALDRELATGRRSAGILIVDDGSASSASLRSSATELRAIRTIDVLHLRRNLGHQRAIAVGLAYIEANLDSDVVLVMDGDGEDRPEDVVRLLQPLEEERGARVIFAERTRRSEGIVFAAFYWLYRVIHLLLTGERVRVGNFSAIPRPLLRRLVAVSDLWNHYAAAVFNARIPFATVPTSRGTRYAGQSQMNFVALATHGLSAMSVFGDRIGVRLLIVTCMLAVAILAASASFAGWHIATARPFPEWSLYALAAIGLLVVLLFATSLAFVFIILAGRNRAGFLPFRDFADFVSHTTSIPVLPVNGDDNLHRD